MIVLILLSSFFIYSLGVLSGLVFFRPLLLKEARNKAFKEAANIIKECGEFVLNESEGRSLPRLNQARVLFEAELEIISMIDKEYS